MCLILSSGSNARSVDYNYKNSFETVYQTSIKISPAKHSHQLKQLKQLIQRKHNPLKNTLS